MSCSLGTSGNLSQISHKSQPLYRTRHRLVSKCSVKCCCPCTDEQKCFPGLPGGPEVERGFCVLEQDPWPLRFHRETCTSPGWKTAKHPRPLQPKRQR